MTDRYSTVARWLHWIIGILVILNIVGGLGHDAMEGLPIPIMPLHKAAGITVLFLTLVRIGWRFTHRAPTLPAEMPLWEKGAAHATHAIFYILLLLVPLTGWIMVSAGTRPLDWFGLFPIPKFAVTKGDAIVGLSGEGHEILGIAFGVLAVLHIAAALRHHFILKDGVLRRMLG
ncbi:cytochrome b [Sphingobium aquiterrae]|uniref:cytochrome b n=1 Tax=Sphingobium aquiterrae TaxID=2038656 RepID=UPI003017BA23